MSAMVHAARPADERTSDPRLALARLLAELARTIREVPDIAYGARPVTRLSGSIGEHVRHCLDHVAAVTATSCQGEVTYDHRLRGTAVETDPAVAVEEIEALCVELAQLHAFPLSRPLEVQLLLERDAVPVGTRSSLGRELAYVVQHTVHHAAVIALLLDRLGLAVPAGLGLAPSSPQRH